MLGITFDVTERKRADEALRESEAQLAHMIRSAMDAVITVDENQRVVIFNSAAEKMFGCSIDEAIGQPIDRFIPERLRAVHREHIRGFGQTRETKRSMGALGALAGVRTDGQEFPIEASISQIEVKGQKLYTVILRDITERKRAEKEREELLEREHAARTEAEIANNIKDEFLATLSHELRTPLTAMLGWLAILRGHRLDKKTTEHAIETIERNTKIQAQLIEDLMDVSRIVGGKLNLEVRPVDLLPLIEAAVEVVRPAADAKGIQIRITPDSFVSSVTGDPARLQQIIWNLLSNAVKFTSRGGTIEVILQRSGSSVEIVIRDTGIGISEDFLPYVFERFRQAESTLTRSQRGLGLGLAIVRHLVELHGGTVSADSAGAGKGSTFIISLPLAATQTTKVNGSLLAAHHLASLDTTGVEALKGLRILVVEDEPDARELLILTLRGSGAEVQAVHSAQQALLDLHSFKPDVLLSDIGLPLESGYDLIQKIRALPSDFSKVPAVALTAFATEKDRQRALASGFQLHLAKPVEPRALIQAIRQLVNSEDGKPGS